MARDAGSWSGWLQSWPLLAAATALVVAGTTGLADTDQRAIIGYVLVSLGAVCLGAWLGQLPAANTYAGRRPPTVRREADAVDGPPDNVVELDQAGGR